MLSYQHSYHAGNFADVHKHTVLTLLFNALVKKPTPFGYMETHAGSGGYFLEDAAAQKNREFADGIGRLFKINDPIVQARTYLDYLHELNTQILTFYPGSPMIARHMLREQDAMILAELHPQEVEHLKQHFRHDKQVAIHHRNGYEMLRALLPLKQARGLVLIDPAYELKSDYQDVVTTLQFIQQRWRTGMAMIWYPILNATQQQKLLEAIQAANLRDVWNCDLRLHDWNSPAGMKGSGVVLMNLPYQMDAQLTQLMPWLARQLAVDDDTPQWRVQQICAE